MKSVVICGSTRFKTEIRAFTDILKKEGVTVFEPYLFSSNEEEWAQLPQEQKNYIALGLAHDHFYKIRTADVVFIYNKNGYSGNSTTLEIGHAVACNKPLYALEQDRDEISRNVLFREIISTPEQLIVKLR